MYVVLGKKQMYIDINKIMDMLSWNNSKDIQAEGRRLAGDVKCLKIFMQPADKEYGKKVWENCALILKEKSDELLSPYMMELLDWLRDLNWPGACVILERLQNYQEYEWLAWGLGESVRLAKADKDEIWLMNLAELAVGRKVFDYLSDETKDVLLRS